MNQYIYLITLYERTVFFLRVYKRAGFYLIRKKGRAMVLFLIFFVVSCVLQLCVSVFTGAKAAAKDLRTNLGAAFYIRPYEQMTFDNGTVSEGTAPVVSQESINAVAYAVGRELKAYNTEHYGYVKSSQLHFLPGAGDNDAGNMGQVTAVRDSKLTSEFFDGEWTLVSGRHIQPGDENKILISQELADENGLAVGDQVTLTHAGLDQKDGEYVDTIPEKTVFVQAQVIGIFQSGSGGENPDTPTAGKAVNHIFSDSHLLVNLKEQEAGIYEGEIGFFIGDPLKLEEILEQVRTIDSINWEDHILRENDFQYEQVAGSLANLQKLTLALILTTSVLSMGILVLILSLQMRGRVRETGIYLSLGRPKWEIMGQLALETGILLFLGFFAALFIGQLTLGGLNTQIFAHLPQSGAAGYLRLDLLHMGALFLGESGAVLLAVLGAGGMILRLRPKEILSKMS